MHYQSLLSAWIICALTSYIVLVFAGDNCIRSQISPRVLVKKMGYRLRGHVISSSSVGTLLSCGHLCHRNPTCYSVNYIKTIGLCELNDSNNIGDMQVDATSIYLEITVEFSEEYCEDNHCMNGGTCTKSCGTKCTGFLPYQCQCLNGFKGLHCEDEITPIVEVARGKNTYQSSVFEFGGVGSLAVDGDFSTRFQIPGSNPACAHTTRIYQPWWLLDLKQSYAVTRVILTNRGDCCSERLINGETRIGHTTMFTDNTLCGHSVTADDTTNGLNITMDCDEHTYGRFVSFQLIGKIEYLTLCEVQVFVDVTVWDVLLKGVSGSGVSIYNMWHTDNSVGCESDKDINSPDNYRSNKIHQWENLDIKYVKLSAYTQGWEVVAVVFNATGSTMTDWFHPDRVISSMWAKNIKASTPNIFSIEGQVGLNVERRFFMSHSDNGCVGDKGWFVILEKNSPTQCTWEDPSGQVPVFLYSTKLVASQWDSTDVSMAEIFTISISVNK